LEKELDLRVNEINKVFDDASGQTPNGFAIEVVEVDILKPTLPELLFNGRLRLMKELNGYFKDISDFSRFWSVVRIW
jgi:hypothetical protein